MQDPIRNYILDTNPSDRGRCSHSSRRQRAIFGSFDVSINVTIYPIIPNHPSTAENVAENKNKRHLTQNKADGSPRVILNLENTSKNGTPHCQGGISTMDMKTIMNGSVGQYACLTYLQQKWQGCHCICRIETHLWDPGGVQGSWI